jgi:anti-sigma factor RsiW
MCDYQGKLIAWLDRELPEHEAADVERHAQGCRECRSQVAAYEHLSRAFDAYCDATVAGKTHRRVVPRWVPALSAAVVALVVLFLAFPRAPVELPRAHAPIVAAVPVTVLEPTSALRKKTHRRRAVTMPHEQAANWLPAEPAVQIAIPAEAMFPPGAVPEGMKFIAELSIGPDGSVEQLRLRP